MCEQIIYYVFMVLPLPRKPIQFDQPAIYQISIEGKIDPIWSERLGGMTIGHATVEASRPVTTLEGELTDQAALAGVLNTLYDLHLTLLEVKRLAIEG